MYMSSYLIILALIMSVCLGIGLLILKYTNTDSEAASIGTGLIVTPVIIFILVAYLFTLK